MGCFQNIPTQSGATQKVEMVAKVELDEATGALQSQLAAVEDAHKVSSACLQKFEERAVAWDGLCDRMESQAAAAAAARESLKDVFAQVTPPHPHILPLISILHSFEPACFSIADITFAEWTGEMVICVLVAYSINSSQAAFECRRPQLSQTIYRTAMRRSRRSPFDSTRLWRRLIASPPCLLYTSPSPRD